MYEKLNKNEILIQIQRSLSQHRPKPVLGDFPKEAAVLLPFIETSSNGLEMMFTVRSGHLSQHAGEISFPGGKVESQDASLMVTAMRETEEETGIAGDKVTILGELSPVISKTGIHVTPFVGMVHSSARWGHSSDEIDEIFTVPLEFFLTTAPVFTEIRQRLTGLRIPEYQYQQYRIWGLTAMIIVEFMNVVFDRRYDLRFQEHVRDVIVQQLVGKTSIGDKDN
ncbi:CoA pyrophosphatase [Gynuella sunshinyii]|uniref:NTP pyrophosphohydrolase including oxidative damage repair enzyme n=1 Tax=Gynuella sunshinyii YC6258 TaxID=1445510 RepID=A0A0C5VZQ6_9GAMM|nr:CoA pyrophosphatase [Gynuella sunshinyii]AJQ95914.1 NTP pyrophosphohydrolase including oxidative damage repair enzyme [Gynuella sunshinyii YC6258]